MSPGEQKQEIKNVRSVDDANAGSGWGKNSSREHTSINTLSKRMSVGITAVCQNRYTNLMLGVHQSYWHRAAALQSAVGDARRPVEAGSQFTINGFIAKCMYNRVRVRTDE
jgi:hypothetical protein